MASSLSNLVNNVTAKVHKNKYKYCDCFFEYENVNDNLLNYKWLCCDKSYSKIHLSFLMTSINLFFC